MEFFKKKKKHSEDETDDFYELDEDSDLPVHEKFTKEKKLKKIKKEKLEI